MNLPPLRFISSPVRNRELDHRLLHDSKTLTQLFHDVTLFDYIQQGFGKRQDDWRRTLLRRSLKIM
jgi:hypothetical protein